MLNPEEFYELLAREKIKFFCGVPDSLLKEFNSCVQDKCSNKNHIITSNEGSAIALASGYHLGTRGLPLIYMQNSGQGNALNPLVSLADKEIYSIPLILLIGWRGQPETPDEPQHLKQGKITLKLLENLGIDYEILPPEMSLAEETVKRLVKTAKEKNSPVAIVVKKNTFSPYHKKIPVKKKYNLTREEVIQEIVKSLEKDSVIISTTGKISRELFEVREAFGQGHEKDFLTVGSMGHSSQIALGISLTKENKEVYCLDGDGAFIMHMGSITTIGKLAPSNFKHIILNNGAHESVGKQPTAGFDMDIPSIAIASGYKNAWSTENFEDLKNKLRLLKESEGPSLLEIKINLDSRKDLERPTKSLIENKKEFMDFLER